MNKKKFAWLIFMMLISIVGITWVQIIWIKNAIKIRNDSFDYIVNASLGTARNRIETAQKINSYLSDLPGNVIGQDEFSGYISFGSSILDKEGNFTMRFSSRSVTGAPGSEPQVVAHDTTFTSNSDSLRAGGLSGSVYIRKKEFLDWIKRRSSEYQSLNDQMVAEIYQWEKAMDINKREVELALKQSLLFNDIQAPFEFAIIRDGIVQDGNFKKAAREDFLKSKYLVRLFPDNIIRQDLILSVIFPTRTNYVLGWMGWILGGSMLFSLVILATFGLSLFFLLRQKKISEMKSDFINNMTHEFKTPIATISLAADTIMNPKVIKDEKSIRHFISLIKKENSRMNKKVETILQIASLDKKEIDFHFENHSLHSIIEKVADTMEIQAHQKNGRIRLQLDAGEPVIYGDTEHLSNLVTNLLDNAIKYSVNSPEILVETKNIERGILLSVEDKGIGMTKSVQSKIFERFYRQNSGNVHDVKGFGLGLNYVRAIIDAHKGNISVTSEPGKGSRFDIYLPFNWEN